jgi:preprotein translocase subunit SecE
VSAFIKELFQFGLYKRTQGRIARQLTFAAIAVVFVIGGWRFTQVSNLNDPTLTNGIAGLIVLAGCWVGYRLVNFPKFADFLVSVEAEMAKVSWPTKHELYASTIVVLVVMAVLTTALFLFDMFWVRVFQAIGIQ